MTFSQKYIVAVLSLYFCVFVEVQAQDTTTSKLEQADNSFEQENYAQALDIYLEASRKNIEDPLLKYKIGVCYFNSKNHKRKAIGYFEFAKNYGKEQVPPEVYYYLGRCYHFSYRFVEAINMFNIYQDELDKKGIEGEFNNTNQLIEMCENGARFIKNPVNSVSVQILDYPVNTSYDDYAPLVSNDGRMLIFSSSRPQNSVHLVLGDQYTFLPPNLQSSTEAMHMSTRKGIDWSFPYPQDVAGKKVETLSISSDNSMLLLKIIEEGASDGEIYLSKRKRGRWSEPKKIGGKINSKYKERGACFSESGEVIYISSNRPGGYGGFDLYKCVKTGKYDWGYPQNLGPIINSVGDEVNPFMHPDTRTLYFSSNGHDTMGGYDIFQIKKQEDESWTTPKNLGYPINSAFDEDHFTQVPNGQYAYLSSNRIDNKSLGMNDIISIFKPQKKLPLAMMRGVIKVNEEGKNLPVTLKVLDSDTQKEQPYVYNPDEKTGNYFVILRPNKHYSISLEVNGNEVDRIEVDIPEKTYSYELNHTLKIEPFRLFGQVVGSAVKVDSATSNFEITKLSEIQATESGTEYRYDAMVLLMEQLIATVDYEGWAKLNELEDSQDTYENVPDFAARESDYYQKLYERVKRAFDDANAQILSGLVGPQMQGSKTVLFGKTDNLGRKVITKYPLAFAKGASRLGRNHIQNLEQLATFLSSMPGIGAEFVAKAQDNASNRDNYNKIISNIQEVLQENGIGTTDVQFNDLQPLESGETGSNNLVIDVIVYETRDN